MSCKPEVFSSSSVNQNKNNYMFRICTKHVNQQRIFLQFWFNQRNQGSVLYDISCTIKLSSRVNQIQKGNSCMKHVNKKENHPSENISHST